MKDIWPVLHESGCRDEEEVTRIIVRGGTCEMTKVLSTEQLLGNDFCVRDITAHLGKLLG